MIKTELEYNPYLNETKIKFNGNEPRINSLVEKHLKSKLQSWIKNVPRIFHDEMNGYDFDFLFSGTELEFEELKKAFADAKVTEEEVKLIHINKLESRNEKLERIENLLNWLKNKNSVRFDFDDFLERNKELINDEYHYIVLHADFQNVYNLEKRYIKPDSIMDINELINTDLSNTPILFYINQNALSLLQNELKVLLSREDVVIDQLFFYVDQDLSESFVKRTLIDLGIKEPQILKTVDDKLVIKYMEVCPITKYISEMINLFKHTYSTIEKVLEAESEKVAITNKSVHAKINQLDESMEYLRKAVEFFENKDELYLIDSYQFLKTNYYKKISKWKSRKTKVNSSADAEKDALDLVQNVFKWLDEFKEELCAKEEAIRADIYQIRNEWYISGRHNLDYQSKVCLRECEINMSIDEKLAEELIGMKHEEWVVPDKGLLAQIFNTSEVEEEPVLQTTWFMSEWKEYINNIVIPIIESYILDSITRIFDYAIALEEDYKKSLKEMLNDEMNEKDNLVSQLSAEERQLEVDFNWLKEFEDQLMKIERE